MSPTRGPEFKLRYPAFKLEDELFREGGRDVMLSYVWTPILVQVEHLVEFESFEYRLV
jgi:hypothetical protein